MSIDKGFEAWQRLPGEIAVQYKVGGIRAGAKLYVELQHIARNIS